MSTFATPVVQILSVEDHPNADRLSIVKVLGYTCISNKHEDGSHRYKEGDWVVYIPSASLVPEWLLKRMGFWHEETSKGTLAGSSGNRVKPLKLRGIYSEGLLYPVMEGFIKNDITIHEVEPTEDLSEFLGIKKFEPIIPACFAGQVANLFGHTIKYDFERWESVPDIFDVGETVVASEKIHGTCCTLIFVPGLNHPEMFGSNGEIIVHSKGLGAQGLAFKNVPENDNNVYVKTLKGLLENGLEEKLRRISQRHENRSVALLGEVFGKGIQDLVYGTSKPEFRIFDMIGGHRYLMPDVMKQICQEFELDTVPELYSGPFDLDEIIKVRDGKTLLGGGNIKEGVVVRSLRDRHPYHGRRIAKFISPAYLLRKSPKGQELTEFT